MIKHPNKNIAVHTWDWKEQPDWDSISAIINEFQESGEEIAIENIDTGSDEYAVVLSTKDIPKDLVDQAYQQYYEWEDGVCADELDFDLASKTLMQLRLEYTNLELAGFSYLQTAINPLFLRLEHGERTKELYDSIMDLQ